MNFLLFAVLLASVALGPGCRTTKQGVVLDPVGPPVLSKTKISTQGTLVVYSAQEVDADFNARDPYRPEYSDYKIFTPDGNLLRRIHNNSGTLLQDPLPVSLPSGRYRVVALANGYGFVTVPVDIQPDQTTELHLEEDGDWPEGPTANQTNVVRLPDGQVVGWKASPGMPTTEASQGDLESLPGN